MDLYGSLGLCGYFIMLMDLYEMNDSKSRVNC